jgi:hypothetical protein
LPRGLSYGLEIAFGSGHADRGFIMTNRPVVQPVTWVTWGGAEFSVWSNLPLAQTADGVRPQVVEFELVREHRWGRLTVAPAIQMFFYHDVARRERDRSVEGWLYLSYDVGPFSVFANHSLDVLNYRDAYFVDFGLESEHHVAQPLAIGGLVGAGWGSAHFNLAYADVARRALDRVTAEAWLTASVHRFYIGPHLEFSTIVDRAVRARLLRPTYVLVRLTMGGEF